jgi:hypothetical protein
VRLLAAPGTDPKRLRALLAAAERFCVNLDTLCGGIEVETSAGFEVPGCVPKGTPIGTLTFAPVCPDECAPSTGTTKRPSDRPRYRLLRWPW